MSNSDNMREFFDRAAPGWDNLPEEAATRDALMEKMAIPTGSVIADIGCGQGVFFPHLLKTAPKSIIGVDLSGEMLRYAREKFSDGRIQLIQGDILEAELPRLDAAVLYNCYPHLLDKAALARRLAELVRPGGIAVIAHGAGKAVINARHRDGLPFTLSAPLEEPEAEAEKFAPWFRADRMEDTEGWYLLRMVRTPFSPLD